MLPMDKRLPAIRPEILAAQMKVIEGLVAGDAASHVFMSAFQGLTMRFPKCMAAIWTVEKNTEGVELSFIAEVNTPASLLDALSVFNADGEDTETLFANDKTVNVDAVTKKMESLFQRVGVHGITVHPLLNKQKKLLGVLAVGFEQKVELSKTEQGIIEQYVRVGGLALEREQLERENHFLTYYDYLTGIPNRRFFYEQFAKDLQQAAEVSEPLSLAMVDLDNFKYINDTFGHGVGDRLLLMISQRISKLLRKADTVARIGGDEFSMILPGMDGESSLAHLRTVLFEVNQPAEIDGWRFPVSASIGIASFPIHGTDTEALLKHADMALYTTKRSEKLQINLYHTDK